jgi:hypothetical protein
MINTKHSVNHKKQPFILEILTTSTNQSVTIPMSSGYVINYKIDWGDGSTPSRVASYNDANATHIYATAGTYQIKINGIIESFYVNNAGTLRTTIKKVIAWGRYQFKELSFYGCANLNELPTVSVSKLRFEGTSLLRGFCTTGLLSIPTDLFRYSTKVTNFQSCFCSCTSLTSIPTDLFRYNTAVTTFLQCFYNCTSLTSIPTDLFRYNTAVTIFLDCFYNCTSLISIPTDLFRYNTAVTTFQGCFNGCSSLASIPTDAFRYNTAVTTFESCFLNCSSLASISTDLFRYNTAVTTFIYCLYGCTALQLHTTIFCAVTEKTTRFLNKSINFTECFYRTSFTGSQGTAPDIWNYSYGTGTPTTTTCFGGAGNSVTSISNYADIPAGWK